MFWLDTHVLWSCMASWNIFLILEIIVWSEQSQAVFRITGRKSLKWEGIKKNYNIREFQEKWTLFSCHKCMPIHVRCKEFIWFTLLTVETWRYKKVIFLLVQMRSCIVPSQSLYLWWNLLQHVFLKKCKQLRYDC